MTGERSPKPTEHVRTVLLPSDGTEWVVEHAIHVARMDEATLHVLHVVDTSVAPLDAHSRSVYDELAAVGRR